MLRFLGRGSAFTDEHNCAYFVSDREMVLLDCPMGALAKLKKKDLASYSRIYVLITHPHGDHSSGLGMLVDYLYFIVKTPITIVAPSGIVYDDLKYLLRNIEGCEDAWYELITADKLDKEWFGEAIPTTHAEQLAGKCFGYLLHVEEKNVVYTGDTNTLIPFEKHLSAGDLLYTEVSCHPSSVHLFCEDIKETIGELTKKGVHVFLMHLDEEEKIERIMKGTGAKLAPLE